MDFGHFWVTSVLISFWTLEPFGFKEKYLGTDEEGNDQYKYGKSEWFKFRSLTWLEKPATPW